MKYILIGLLITTAHCMAQEPVLKPDKEKQAAIAEQYYENCAQKYSYAYQMKEWQHCLDAGLAVDSTIARLWQKKAMPYFKLKKYEVGMQYLDQAVRYDAESWQPYRAFIKCIFSKQYREAIKDFEDCMAKWGNQYEMGHSYTFHIALCHLQLNEFEKAEALFIHSIKEEEQKWGVAHFMDLYYYAITKYELEKYEEAIVLFDKVLTIYPQFSDVLYYKALTLFRQGKSDKIYNEMIEEAKEYARQGYTINEDNVIYEPYPYQVKWK